MSAEPVDVIPTEEDEDLINVYGPTARESSMIVSVALTTVIGLGERKDGKSVLVPYVECEIIQARGTDDDEEDEERTLTCVLTLDNLAFVLEELSSGLAALMPPIASLGRGELRIPEDRIAYTAESISRAMSELASVNETLHGLRETAEGQTAAS